MAKYLMIESRDPFDSNDVARNLELARNLRAEGNEVTVFLVQNGVLPARRSTQSLVFGEMSKAGIEVLADDFSLRERAIPADRLAEGVKAAPLSVVIDRLGQHCKAIWH